MGAPLPRRGIPTPNGLPRKRSEIPPIRGHLPIERGPQALLRRCVPEIGFGSGAVISSVSRRGSDSPSGQTSWTRAGEAGASSPGRSGGRGQGALLQGRVFRPCLLQPSLCPVGGRGGPSRRRRPDRDRGAHHVPRGGREGVAGRGRDDGAPLRQGRRGRVPRASASAMASRCAEAAQRRSSTRTSSSSGWRKGGSDKRQS